MKVGVVIPVRNAMPHLPHMLASIEAQTYPETEVYLSVDPCDDDTRDWLCEHPAAFTDLDWNPVRLGWHQGLNRAAELAIEDGCDAIFTASADDILHPDCIRRCADEILGRCFVVPYSQQFDGGTKIQMSHPDLTLKHFTRWPMLTDKALISRGTWMLVGGYSTDVAPEAAPYGCAEDWEFWIKVWKAGVNKYAVITDPLYFVRVHEAQLSNRREVFHSETVELIRRKHPDLPWDHLSGVWPPVYWDPKKKGRR
jgi:glycosyltransferase involved in cell wall biosynthesis